MPKSVQQRCSESPWLWLAASSGRSSSTEARGWLVTEMLPVLPAGALLRLTGFQNTAPKIEGIVTFARMAGVETVKSEGP